MRSCPRCRSIYSGQIEFCGLDGTRLIDGDDDPLIGATIDRYRITARLGEGGMASVYRATHTTLDREYAVKLLHGEIASDRTFAERFRREAQAVSKINHQNVVSVSDYGSTPDGLTFLVMELLRGETLRDAIKEAGSLPPDRARSIARQIAAGLSVAHKLGFVHRDLKPGNVMLVDIDGKEVAKILDFGLVGVANREGSAEEKGRLTQTGNTMGTPYYMAPEQIRGENATPSTDLYSLGTVMFEMLTGKPPFAGSMTEVLFKHAIEPAPPLPDAGGLERIVKSLLEKEASARPASADALIAELDKLGPPPSMPSLRVSSESLSRAPYPTPLSTPLAAASVASDSIVIPLPARGTLIAILVVVTVIAMALAGTMLWSSGDTTVVNADAWIPPPFLDAEASNAVAVNPLAVLPDAGEAEELDAATAAPDAAQAVAVVPPPPPPLPPREREREKEKEEAAEHAHPKHNGGGGGVEKNARIEKLETGIEDSLRRRGMSLDDLAAAEGTGAAVRRWREAKHGQNLREAEKAGEVVLADVSKFRLDVRFLRKKLDRIEESMKGAPREKLPGFESRYLDLSGSALRRGLDQPEYAELSRRIAQLQRDINASKR